MLPNQQHEASDTRNCPITKCSISHWSQVTSHNTPYHRFFLTDPIRHTNMSTLGTWYPEIPAYPSLPSDEALIRPGTYLCRSVLGVCEHAAVHILPLGEQFVGLGLQFARMRRVLAHKVTLWGRREARHNESLLAALQDMSHRIDRDINHRDRNSSHDVRRTE